MNLSFNNRFTAALPADPEADNYRRQIQHALYSRVQPTEVSAPSLVACAPQVAALLGLSEDDCQREEFLQVFSGNQTLPGMDPHATCYGGHQFGNWAGQLGDGRAINLGEVEAGNHHQTLQLKGAGPTPYSRTADGLAVLRSSVREFLCSEAMFHLGVPTTRALSLVRTGEWVTRDMLYDGNAKDEPGAVVCRVSPSFVRFGHFQMLTARNEIELLRRFTDFVIQRDFSHLPDAQNPTRDTYLAWFNEVTERTMTLMVHWMRVGFVHGVMNTDNMSIIGETIDYGPYGWLEDFDPNWTPNTTDATNRRYRYSQQPVIGQWNLMQLANAILPLIEDTKPLEEILSGYASSYENQWRRMMTEKLGLADFDEPLVNELMQLLAAVETDMTLFFRALASADLTSANPGAQFTDTYYRPDEIQTGHLERTNAWLADYAGALHTQAVDVEHRHLTMNRVNPKYVLRNYLAQLAIDDAERGDYGRIHELFETLTRPYDEQPTKTHLAEKRPEWARTRAGCSMLSCSS